MRATRTFTDKAGVMRRNGEEWLIKMEDTEAHIPDVYEEVSRSPGPEIKPGSQEAQQPLPNSPVPLCALKNSIVVLQQSLKA